MNSQRSKALSLKQEAKSIFASSHVIQRAAEYSPTLEELQTIPFYDYIRHNLLGVPRAPLDADDKQTKDSDLGEVSAMYEESNSNQLDRDDQVLTRSSKRKAMEAKEQRFLNQYPPKQKFFALNSYSKSHKRCKTNGIAKVTLPEGWCDQEGIAKDPSARGEKTYALQIAHFIWYFNYGEYSGKLVQNLEIKS